MSATFCLFFHSCHGRKLSLKQEDINSLYQRVHCGQILTQNTKHIQFLCSRRLVVWFWSFNSRGNPLKWFFCELSLPIINNLKALDWDIDHHGRQPRAILFPADFSRPPSLSHEHILRAAAPFVTDKLLEPSVSHFCRRKTNYDKAVWDWDRKKKNPTCLILFFPSSSFFFFTVSSSWSYSAFVTGSRQTKLERETRSWSGGNTGPDTVNLHNLQRFWLKNSK